MKESEEIYAWVGGVRYVRRRSGWVTREGMTAPTEIAQKLSEKARKKLAAADDAVSGLHELLDLAKEARGAGEFRRALDLTRRAWKMRPNDPRVAVVACSILRRQNKSEVAVEVGNRFPRTTYQPLLVSHAAALCDVKQYKKALQRIRSALEIDGSDEAFNVHMRIKAEAPELFN